MPPIFLANWSAAFFRCSKSLAGNSFKPKTDDMREALATAVNEVADRLCTDWGELQHPADVLREIADELEAL